MHPIRCQTSCRYQSWDRISQFPIFGLNQRFSNCGGAKECLGGGANGDTSLLGPALHGGAQGESVILTSLGNPACESVSTSTTAVPISAPSSLCTQCWLHPQRPSHAPSPILKTHVGGAGIESVFLWGWGQPKIVTQLKEFKSCWIRLLSTCPVSQLHLPSISSWVLAHSL